MELNMELNMELEMENEGLVSCVRGTIMMMMMVVYLFRCGECGVGGWD